MVDCCSHGKAAVRDVCAPGRAAGGAKERAACAEICMIDDDEKIPPDGKTPMVDCRSHGQAADRDIGRTGRAAGPRKRLHTCAGIMIDRMEPTYQFDYVHQSAQSVPPSTISKIRHDPAT